MGLPCRSKGQAPSTESPTGARALLSRGKGPLRAYSPTQGQQHQRANRPPASAPPKLWPLATERPLLRPPILGCWGLEHPRAPSKALFLPVQ